jgi:molecular chaperone HscA
MVLLQISEPGESPAPHQRKVAIGIDLGTTNSLVAVVKNGSAEVLADEAGRPLLPSVVRYEAKAAASPSASRRRSTWHTIRATPIASVKRFMGRAVARRAEHRQRALRFRRRARHAQVADRRRAEEPGRSLGRDPEVAARRAEAQLLSGSTTELGGRGRHRYPRTSTTRSARQPRTRRSSPASTCCAFSTNRPRPPSPMASTIAAEGIYAVYDLAAAPFDISILRLSKGVFEVLSTGGDSALGGDDFDHRLYCWALDEARLALLTPEDTRLLLMKSREAKESLTLHGVARINATLTDGRKINVTVSQAKFFEITQHLVQKTIGPVKKALRDAGLAPEDVRGVVMVGGATRMPHVQRAVAQVFGTAPLNNLDPDKVVAPRRGDAGQPARGQRRRRRRGLAAARRDPASRSASRRWAARREDHSRAIRRSRSREARSSRRSRTARRRWRSTCCRASARGVRLPVARALRAARESRRWSPGPRGSR